MTAASGPPIVLVAAVAPHGVIGRDGSLAWHIPEDMAHFKAITAGCTVVMGRSTWLSIPPRFRPLPGRRNIVLSRQTGFTAPGAEVAPSLESALALARTPGASQTPPPAICIIGGAQVYAAALPICDRLEITHIERAFEGDARFPPWPREAFVETARRRVQAAPPNGFALDFVTYERRRGASPAPGAGG